MLLWKCQKYNDFKRKLIKCGRQFPNLCYNKNTGVLRPKSAEIRLKN
jgi:hypothetical protein